MLCTASLRHNDTKKCLLLALATLMILLILSWINLLDLLDMTKHIVKQTGATVNVNVKYALSNGYIMIQWKPHKSYVQKDLNDLMNIK